MSGTELQEADAFFEDYENRFAEAEEQLKELKRLAGRAVEAINDPNTDATEAVDRVLNYLGCEGNGCLEFFGEAHLILRIFGILKSEAQLKVDSFARGTESPEDLITQYEETKFALRRIGFGLSEEAMLEGYRFLVIKMPSPIAVYMILNGEKAEKNAEARARIKALCGEFWDEGERALFDAFCKE